MLKRKEIFVSIILLLCYSYKIISGSTPDLFAKTSALRPQASDFNNRELVSKFNKTSNASNTEDIHTVFKETAGIHRRIQTDVKAVKASVRAEELHEKKLLLEEKKLSQGRSNIKTVLDFQDDLQESQLQTARRLIDFTLAQVQLEYIQGTLLKYMDIKP